MIRQVADQYFLRSIVAGRTAILVCRRMQNHEYLHLCHICGEGRQFHTTYPLAREFTGLPVSTTVVQSV
jgi:hypothetical protein